MKRPSGTVPWYEVYHQLAIRLQKFQNKNSKNPGNALFRLLYSSEIYKTNNLWLSNMSRINTPSIDPIQLFVSFSRSRQPEYIRSEIIDTVWRLLGTTKAYWKDINFEGCPTPMALKLQYVRPETVQLKIWKTFKDAMTLGKKVLNQQLWDEVKEWRGIEIPSFTIFLFWIEPTQFMPLDKNTRLYLERSFLLSKHSVITFAEYQTLLSNSQLKNYVKISTEAFYFNNEPEIFKKKFRNNSLQPAIQNSAIFSIIGIRILKRNKMFHKILKPNKYYPLDNSITPQHPESENENISESFIYKFSGAEALYNLQNLKVNITAIVGKNGSGKSTILDLLLMGIYNLSIQLGYLDKKLHKMLKSLNFEIYWITDTLYKLSFENEATIYCFQQKKENDQKIVYELLPNPLPIEDLNVNGFYSILINYSHYALNSREQKIDWITPLCHKNDGYLTPVVINPQRTDGNIDINNEKDLLNMRLLLNLLELHDADIPEQSFRYLDNGKYLRSFSILLDKLKNAQKQKQVRSRINNPEIIKAVMTRVSDVFLLTETMSLETAFKEQLEYYIVDKLLTIIERYERYRQKYKLISDSLVLQNAAIDRQGPGRKLESGLNRAIIELLEEIKGDKSHITLKIKQAVYYLKYPTLQKALEDSMESVIPVELDKYNELIEDIINSETEIVTEAELLPPAIFKLDFHLNDPDKSSFSKASSGEYQFVSVLSSILYHLRNIDSVTEGQKYNYVTIILDEIELYFHPNMQRFFVRRLLEALSKLDNELYGVQIMFATHSPFILSDIQQEKILKLKNGAIESNENGYNTFAANIHDLLADEFFLDQGYMGAFAQKQIESAINLLNYINADNELKHLTKNPNKLSTRELSYLKRKFENDLHLYKLTLDSFGYLENGELMEKWRGESGQHYIRKLIEIVGEPLIKDKLNSMYQKAFPENADEETTVRNEAKLAILQMMKENNINTEDLK